MDNENIRQGAPDPALRAAVEPGGTPFHESRLIDDLRVLSSDGQPLGVVDRVEGNRLKLKRRESIDGQYGYLDLSLVERVEDDVAVLSMTYPEAQAAMTAEETDDTRHAG